MMSKVLSALGVVALGALGALLFVVLVFPWMLGNPYFDRFQFIKNFKDGRIVVNPVQQVYVQEDVAIQDAAQRVKNSVIATRGIMVASGLVASSDGQVVMPANAVPANAAVTIAGQDMAFTLVKTDSKHNLALLKVDANDLETVPFVSFGKVALGQSVFFVSPAPGTQWRLNQGVVAEIGTDVIVTTMSAKQMAPGTPVFDAAGELLGLGFSDADGNVSLIPVADIQNLLGL